MDNIYNYVEFLLEKAKRVFVGKRALWGQGGRERGGGVGGCVFWTPFYAFSSPPLSLCRSLVSFISIHAKSTTFHFSLHSTCTSSHTNLSLTRTNKLNPNMYWKPILYFWEKYIKHEWDHMFILKIPDVMCATIVFGWSKISYIQ